MPEIVATPLAMQLRKVWFQAHKWIALVLMMVLIPLGLSGIVLTWDDAIDHALNPQRYAARGPVRVSAGALVAAARAASAPGERIASIRYPGSDGGPVTIVANAVPHGKRHSTPIRDTIWLDPADGHVLDVRHGDSGLVRIAHTFHGSLFVPGVGRALVGLLGVALFLMAASGVWLWLPPLSRWTSGLRWQRGDRRTVTNVHHLVGFWICLPLAAQAFTGIWIAAPQMIALVGGDGGSGGVRMRPQPIEAPILSPDVALAMAQIAAPGAPTAINWPTAKDGPWRILLATPKGPVDVTVGDLDGMTKLTPSRGGDLAVAMRHWHDGTTLGFVWRLVMVLIGLAPTLLGITGLLMWLRSRRWRNPRPANARRVTA